MKKKLIQQLSEVIVIYSAQILGFGVKLFYIILFLLAIFSILPTVNISGTCYMPLIIFISEMISILSMYACLCVCAYVKVMDLSYIIQVANGTDIN